MALRGFVQPPGGHRQPRHDSGGMGLRATWSRLLGLAAALFAAAAITSRLLEARNFLERPCRDDCWCRRRPLTVFAWVVPFGHTSTGWWVDEQH